MVIRPIASLGRNSHLDRSGMLWIDAIEQDKYIQNSSFSLSLVFYIDSGWSTCEYHRSDITNQKGTIGERLQHKQFIGFILLSFPGMHEFCPVSGMSNCSAQTANKLTPCSFDIWAQEGTAGHTTHKEMNHFYHCFNWTLIEKTETIKNYILQIEMNELMCMCIQRERERRLHPTESPCWIKIVFLTAFYLLYTFVMMYGDVFMCGHSNNFNLFMCCVHS